MSSGSRVQNAGEPPLLSNGWEGIKRAFLGRSLGGGQGLGVQPDWGRVGRQKCGGGATSCHGTREGGRFGRKERGKPAQVHSEEGAELRRG